VTGWLKPAHLRLALLLTLTTIAAATTCAEPAAERGTISRDTYLDRLRMAESGGRNDARNPRSTALGPYQFIASTFLDVTRRHLPDRIIDLTEAQILALRTDPVIARLAADAYTRDCAAELQSSGLPASYPHLRLAYLLGPKAAIRVLTAEPRSPIEPLVGGAVVVANPFLKGMSAADLVQRAARDISVDAPRMQAAVGGQPDRSPAVKVQCDLDRASCRKWLALAEARVQRGGKVRVASRL